MSRIEWMKHGLLAVVLVALAGCPQPRPSTGGVNGTVSLKDGGSPAGAVVSAGGQSQTVGADGAFAFTELPAGPVLVRAVREGFLTTEQSVEVPRGERATVALVLERPVTPNRSPQVSGVLVSPAQLDPGATAALSATATDPDGDALTFTWMADNGFTVAPSASEPGRATLTAPSSSGTTGTVTLVVDDGKGGAVTVRVGVATAPNRVPVIGSLTATPPTVRRGGSISLSASASDPDGDPLVYDWTAPAGWRVTAEGPNATLSAPDQPAQTASIQLRVTDSRGNHVSGSVTVSTAENRGPVLSTLSAEPLVAARGGNIVLLASASDPDGDALTYEWSAPAGWTVTANAHTATVRAPNLPGQSATLGVTVRDASGATVMASVLVSTAGNAAPVLSSVTATGNPAARGGTVTLNASAQDADGDALTYVWNVPSGWTLNGSGAQVTVTAPNTPSANGTVTVTVSDPFGGSTTGSLGVATRENAAPVLSTVTATGSPAARGGTITLTASAQDADGDRLTYAWSVAEPGWEVVGSGAIVALTAPNASGRSTTVTVTVADGQGGSVTGTVAVSTRENRLPQLQSLSASPPAQLPGGNISVTASANDADGDSLSYAWSTDDAGWTVVGSGPNVTVRAPYANDASTSLVVTVTDGAGGSVSGTVLLSTGVCAAGRMNCDRNTANGCEVSLREDPAHCGACGNVCPGSAPYCSNGACTGRFSFTGIRNDVPVATVEGGGWTRCYLGRYDESAPLTAVLAGCTGANLMLACRATGSPTLRLAAYAPRADVLFDTGAAHTTHEANGVGWYFNGETSWGFAPRDAPVYRGACDTLDSSVLNPGGPTANQRLCWHTLSNSLIGGWRCGDQDELNASTDFERVVYQAD